MKILIVSDTHGSTGPLRYVLEQEKDIDMMIHAGDVGKDCDYLKTTMNFPVYIVEGNNDYFMGLPGEIVVPIGSHRVFVTHGHGYYVSAHTIRLKEAARSRQADIVVYGHTHRPDIDTSENVIAINPGSLSYPRQEGWQGTYIIMEINEADEVKITLKHL